MVDIYNVYSMLKNKEVSSKELVEESIKKIKKYDDRYEFMLATNFEQSIILAEQIDNRRMKGEEYGYLSGIPYTCKDNIMTKGIISTCGSRILKDFRPPFSGTIVKEIEKKGGILIGKTNMDELGAGGESISGFRHTKNPFNIEESVSGSSGGSAVTVAIGAVTYALGTDTGGSVREPAEKCGLVGLKPTYGSISRYGVGAYAHTIDQVGFIGNCVMDISILMEELAKEDRKDVITYKRDYSGLVKNLDSFQGKIKVGVLKELESILNKKELKFYVEFIERLNRNKNFELVEVSVPNLRNTASCYKAITSVEGYSNFKKYDGTIYSSKMEGENYKEVIEETQKEGFEERVKAKIIMGKYLLTDENMEIVNKAYKMRSKIEEQLENACKDVDTLILPMESYDKDIYMTALSNLGRTPALELPVKINSKNVPQGIQLVCKKYEDVKLIQIGKIFENFIDFKKGVLDE